MEEAPAVYVETSIGRDELAAMVRRIMPVRIHMTPPEENRLWILLSEPRAVELVPDRGLLVRCRARARVPIFRVLVQVGAPDVAVLLRPRIVSNDGRPRLSFVAEIESFDVRWLPSAA
jgi:hypothetical protein